MRFNDRDNTKKLCNFISVVVPLKRTVGYSDAKPKGNIQKVQK